MLLSKFSIQRRQQDLSLCNSGLDEDQIHQERERRKKKKKLQRLEPRKLMFQLGGPHMKGIFEKKNIYIYFFFDRGKFFENRKKKARKSEMRKL